MKRKYPWKLGGPWYRQESIGGPAERGSRPILQKYASADFVNRFLEEPQKSLQYIGEDFFNLSNGKDIYAPVSPDKRRKGDSLKLFLDSHSRFYLVVCELHCQAPGSPPVARDQVCEAGFVVRRRWTHIAPAARDRIACLKGECNILKIKLEKIQAKQQAMHAVGETTNSMAVFSFKTIQEAGEKALQKRHDALQQELDNNLFALRYLLSNYQSKSVIQKWQTNKKLKESGSWKRLTEDKETPLNITEEDEAIFPLYPLIPDPVDKKHTGQNRTLYFGVVPTSSGDFDAQGNPKFENEHSYSVRCFVRRHKEGCPKKSERADCPGEIVWSEATESYKLAAFTDLDGCGHTPVNIQLPDLNALKAQALRGPIGKGLNVRMNSPANSSLRAAPKDDGISMEEDDWQKSLRNGQVCFFSIPLITIVAFFVLRLFLPIVIFVFQLWFLLKLKICIPPSLAVDADMAADLDVYGPKFEAEIKAEIAIDGSITLGSKTYRNDSDGKAWDKLKTSIEDMLDTLPGYLKKNLKEKLKDNFDAAIEAIIEMTPDLPENPEAMEDPGKLPQATDGLHYFDRVEPT